MDMYIERKKWQNEDGPPVAYALCLNKQQFLSREDTPICTVHPLTSEHTGTNHCSICQNSDMQNLNGQSYKYLSVLLFE